MYFTYFDKAKVVKKRLTLCLVWVLPYNQSLILKIAG